MFALHQAYALAIVAAGGSASTLKSKFPSSNAKDTAFYCNRVCGVIAARGFLSFRSAAL